MARYLLHVETSVKDYERERIIDNAYSYVLSAYAFRMANRPCGYFVTLHQDAHCEMHFAKSVVYIYMYIYIYIYIYQTFDAR